MRTVVGLVLLFVVDHTVCVGGDAPPQRPADFQPFKYEYTTDQLWEKFSAGQMQRAAKELQDIESVNAQGEWKPTWESLDKHSVPEWYQDAKLGIMFNWGAYAVPAWAPDYGAGYAMYPDGYPGGMYNLPPFQAHHAKFWGKDFQYDDFLPLFKAEKYDPAALVALFKEAGARYLITMSKHHDGLAWWDSQWTQRNYVRMGPKKDLLSPLMSAAGKENLKLVLYFCYEEYCSAVLDQNGKPYCRPWTFGADCIHLAEALTPENQRRVSGFVPVSNYYEQYMMPLVKEMIDRFQPDGLWMDGAWATPAETLRSRDLVAYFYNKNAGGKPVYVNDRYGIKTDSHHGDVFISEYNIRGAQKLDHPWEDCQGISKSFAYNYEDNETTLGPPEKLIHRLIDVVSHNGNMAIIGGPDASGIYPDNIVQRLKALGGWLKVNGQAIYATRILKPYTEGNVCYTRSKDGKLAFAICKQWPGTSLTLKGVRAKQGSLITMLGVAEPLIWKQDDQGLVITIPDGLQKEDARPCRHAWSIRVPRDDTGG